MTMEERLLQQIQQLQTENAKLKADNAKLKADQEYIAIMTEVALDE